MNAFRGCLVFFSMPSTIEPHFDGSKFSVSDVVVPSSSDYSIGDLLAAGFKVAPVSTEILHDEDAVSSLPSLDAASNEPSNVDPSNV